LSAKFDKKPKRVKCAYVFDRSTIDSYRLPVISLTVMVCMPAIWNAILIRSEPYFGVGLTEVVTNSSAIVRWIERYW